MSKTYHFIGIKGSGMSALALMLHQMGHKVQGSDVEKYYFTQRGLEQAGIAILPFDEKNLQGDVEISPGTPFLLGCQIQCRGVHQQPRDGPRTGIDGGDEIDPHGDPRGCDRPDQGPLQSWGSTEADCPQESDSDEHIDPAHDQHRGLRILTDKEVMKVVITNRIGTFVKTRRPPYLGVLITRHASRRNTRFEGITIHYIAGHCDGDTDHRLTIDRIHLA